MSATTRAQSATALRALAKRVEVGHAIEATPGHLRDAARTVERGNHEGARRHLIAAMHTFEPRMLYRHGIMNDSGHARARADLGQVHRQYLRVRDLQDEEARADDRRQAAAARRAASNGATTTAGRPPPSPDGGDQPQLSNVLDFVFNPAELRDPHGRWIFGGSSGIKAPGPPGSFEHARWMDRAAETFNTPEVRNAVHEATRAMIGRDLATAHQHMANAIELEQLLGSGRGIGDLRAIDASISKVNPKKAAIRNRPRDPFLHQHPGEYKESHLVSEPRTSMKYKVPNALKAGGYAYANPTTAEQMQIAFIGLAMSDDEVAALNRMDLADGPEPYHKGADETVQCPNCGKWDAPDARFCDQCGHKLPASAFADLSAETGALASTHRPFGKPGGPGLWNVKGMQLPAYIQNIARALLRTGRARNLGHAIAIARAATKKWAKGGGKVHPEVRAASAATGAEWDASRARAHSAHSGQPTSVIELFNPNHAPPGAGGGQFTSAGGAGKGSAPGAKAAVAGTQRAVLVAQVKVLRAQITALQHSLVTGNAPPAGTMPSRTGKAAAGKAGAATARKAAAPSKAQAAKSKSSTPRKHGVTKMSARTRAQVKARIVQLQAQLRSDLAKLRGH